MMTSLIAAGRLADFAELRAFRRDGPPPHLAFELFEDESGKAWTLRVPVAGRTALVNLARAAARRLSAGGSLPEADAEGLAILGVERLAPDDELAAVLLEKDGEVVFALWRREQGRRGWQWTLDAVFAPAHLAQPLCAFVTDIAGRG